MDTHEMEKSMDGKERKAWTPIYLILFLGTFHESPIRNI